MPRTPRPLVSSSRELLWPATPGPQASELLALLYQLQESEWWPSELLEQAQLKQLGPLLAQARRQSSFHRARLESSGLDQGGLLKGDLQKLPVLSRYELLTHADSIVCPERGAEHGGTGSVQTSGSTGQLVVVQRTGACRSMLFALGMRTNGWHQLDYRQTLAVVRADSPLMDDEEKAAALGWGQPVTLLYRTGPAYALPISTDVAAQAAWLVRRQPGYLFTYPTNLAALLDHFERNGRTLPSLRGVRTLGETLTPATRKRCQELWQAPVIDVYSAAEVGVIAIECPESGLYHVQSESLVVEVLDDAGRSCQPGQIGRVVVTDLHNFAMPLVRYDIGDRAEVGPACSCGRGLPTLSRVLGRQRNMVVLPNGERHWPIVGLHQYRRIAPIIQYQVIQESETLVELRLVSERPLSAEQEGELGTVVQRALGHAFDVRFRYFESEIPRGPSGKFEDFISRVN